MFCERPREFQVKSNVASVDVVWDEHADHEREPSRGFGGCGECGPGRAGGSRGPKVPGRSRGV